MAELVATDTNITPVETRGLSLHKPLATFLSALAFVGASAPASYAAEQLPPTATHSEPQKTIHSKALRIIVPPELDAVAGCESGSGPNSAGDYNNPGPGNSTASGRYQILDSTWHYLGGKGRAKNAPDWEQDKYAVKLYKMEGLSPWYPSKHCWAGKVALIRSKK